MADQLVAKSSNESLDDFFGPDQPFSAHVKTELIIPDEKDDFPIKTEAFSAAELKLEIESKQKQIFSMNKEVLALKTKLNQESDPIETFVEDTMSENLLLGDGQVLLGTFDNPVTLSSDDENEESHDDTVKTPPLDDNIPTSIVISSPTTGHNWWVGQDRYIYDMTDANPGNVGEFSENVASPSPDQSRQFTDLTEYIPLDQSQELSPPVDQFMLSSTPGDQFMQSSTQVDQSVHSFPQVLQSVHSSLVQQVTTAPKSIIKSSPLVSDQGLVSSGLFETTFSKKVNKKRVSFAAKNTHIISSSDDSSDENEEPIVKHLKKQLSPNVKPSQKIALTKTVNKDGSKSPSAHIAISSSLPPSQS